MAADSAVHSTTVHPKFLKYSDVKVRTDTPCWEIGAGSIAFDCV
jgi:hypothetical protein